MSNCHNEIVIAASGTDLLLLATIFITGLVASFTHCIAMCGPLAAAQMSMRLINIKPHNMSEIYRLKAAFLLPYYSGKATTYVLLTAFAFIMATPVRLFMNNPFIKYCVFSIYVLVALAFIFSALSKAFSFVVPNTIIKKLELKIINRFSSFKLSTDGLKGFILGMLLGLIPCGLVYSVIINLLSNSSSIYIALVGALLFGTSTIPGLFISAYLGAHVMTNIRSSFRYFYMILLLANALLILRYAFSLLSI